MAVSLSTRNLGRRPGLDPRTLRRRTEQMLAAVDQEDSDLSVLLCDDRLIAELNAAYRDKEGPTDVLSFAQFEGDGPEVQLLPGQPRLLGDVVISMPTAARQAPSGPGGLRLEVTRLLAHGLLHLLGWVHDTDERRAAMEQETERLIAAAQRSPR